MTQKPGTPAPIIERVPIVGLPGQAGHLTVAPIFPDGDCRNQAQPRGLPGDYEATFTLNRPGHPLQPEGSLRSGDILEGDSHLKVGAAFRATVTATGGTFTVEGKANPSGFLASLVTRCKANSLIEARVVCQNAVTPFLSVFALKWDVPLVIYQIDVQEVRTGTREITTRHPFEETTIQGLFVFPVEEDARTYAAIYREALVTESATYQFLCLYRLIESIQARRTRIEREARRLRTSYAPPIERYPRDATEATIFLETIFPAKAPSLHPSRLDAILVTDALGKDFNNIAAQFLKPIRDNIAHTLLQRPTELISMDDPLSLQRVEMWLPVAKCIARGMLKNEFPSLFA